MIGDDPLNPGSTASEVQISRLEHKIDDLKSKYILFFAGDLKQPPEKDREETEKAIRNLIYGGAKTAKMSMIIQNLAARFSLYNNLWLKQLNEMESGVSRLPKKRTATAQPAQPRTERVYREIRLSLNDEDSFEKMFADYLKLLPKNSQKPQDKENIINTLKTKMVTNNLIEATVGIALQNGKLSITIKK